MSDKLIGEDATVARVLEKIELAARRTASRTNDPQITMTIFAEELVKILKDMRQ